MATLHLMVGLPASGKTTLARKLELELPAIRLTPDEWHVRLFGNDATHPDHDDRHSAIEELLWNLAERILKGGLSVILDFGFWSRAERDDFRRRAQELGADAVIHFRPISRQEHYSRLALRNAASPVDSFVIPETQLQEWEALFEAPTEEELRGTR